MKTNTHLIISGIVFTVVLFLWPVFMAIEQPQGADEEQFKWIQDHLILYKLQFIFASLIGPSIIYLMLSQLGKFPENDKIALRAGFVFITGYFVLNSIAYASQIILVPRLIRAGMTEQARVWYFNSSASATYFIDQMGYCFWGIGAIILFFRFLREKGPVKYLSLIYTLSGILSIAAFAGLIIDNAFLNSLTLYSGLILTPVGIITLIWGLKESKKANKPHNN